VGGVSGRLITGQRRGAILASLRSRWWKAPDPWDTISLRGTVEERGSRPVRLVCRGLSPCGRSRRRQRVPRGLPRRGTSSACRQQSACTRREGHRASRARGHVLRSVLGPVHVDRHSTPPAQADGGDALQSVSRSGKSCESGKEPAPRSARADGARLAACHRLLKRGRVMRQKRKGVAASVPARIEELGCSARTS